MASKHCASDTAPTEQTTHKTLSPRHAQQSKSQYLLLSKRIDREIESLRNIGHDSSKSNVQIEGLDRLITYLAVDSSENLRLFWQKLTDLHHLPKRFWIILPSTLVPSDWPQSRLHIVENP
ncbi:MAG: hypothetical protein HC800_23425 [Phormidesmis sp. RL_2_1]|nr:hypothetical protein [Phormidesmis sp. RL_2_1]